METGTWMERTNDETSSDVVDGTGVDGVFRNSPLKSLLNVWVNPVAS
jgi:hypothetical protein